MDNVKARFELDENGFWNARGTSPGHSAAITYAKSIRETRSRFVEALGALWDDVERSEAAHLTVEYVISSKADAALKKARRARSIVEEAQRESERCSRDVARLLTEAGMGVDDASTLLDLSPSSFRRLLRD